MPATYDTRVTGAERCVDIGVLRLARPADYAFRGGQWLRLTLQTAEGAETKTFSIASASGDPEIVLATRDSPSAFKQAWFALQQGDAVAISAAGGRLKLPDAPDPVFLVGGVGITPIRGLVLQAIADGRTLDGAVLVYGNRVPACTPFLGELDDLAERGLTVIPVFEHEARAGDETGFISADMIRRVVPHAEARAYVVTGPPVMVEAMERVLDELAVPEDHRIIERFGPPRV